MEGVKDLFDSLLSVDNKETLDVLIEEDKKKALQDIDLAYKERDLGDHDFGQGGFEATDCVVDYEKEDVIFVLRYQTDDYIEKVGYGLICYDFYIVKREGKYYIKYVDKRELCDVANKISKTRMGNISLGIRYNVGLMTSEYKRYVRYEAMKESSAIIEDEIKDKLKRISKEAFPNNSLDYLTYRSATTKVQVIDYYNGVHFITYDYILPKYSMIVDMIDYIFEKCNILCLKKCNLKFVENYVEAKKAILFKEIEEEYWLK